MRISSWIVTAIALAAFAGEPQAGNAGGEWKNQQVLVVRVGPGVVYAKLVIVPKHQRLQVYHCAAWCDVTWGAYHGYVQSKYVIGGVTDPANLTPRIHLPCVTPVFADHLNVSAVTRHG